MTNQKMTTIAIEAVSVAGTPTARELSPSGAAGSKRLEIALWAAQIVLAVIFALTGAMKTFLPASVLLARLPDLATVPLPFVRLLGIAELAAAAGLVLPALTRIAPLLTPLAASGVTLVMIGAFVFHLRAGHLASLPLVVVLCLAAVFVAWGRSTRARVPPRTTAEREGEGR